MNPPETPPQSTNPQIPPVLPGSDFKPLEQGPGLRSAFEALLKHPLQVVFQLSSGTQERLLASLAAITVMGVIVYGVIVGTFSGGAQIWIAPLKILFGTFLSALICLPSLFIFSCLGGSDARLSAVSGLLHGALALGAILLLGFAPVAWIFSESTTSVVFMGALHLAIWLVAIAGGLRFLFMGLDQLGGITPGFRRVWITVFLLVALQMTTTLRPILGRSDKLLPVEKKFFVTHWFDCMEAKK
jgi:hypothetical protein